MGTMLRIGKIVAVRFDLAHHKPATAKLKISAVDGGGLRSGRVIRFFGGFLLELFDGTEGGVGGKMDSLTQGYTGGFGEPVGFDGGLREALLAVKGGLFFGHRGKAVDCGRETREVED